MDQVFNAIHSVDPIDVVIDGAANGADTLGYNWAKKNEVDSYRCRAKWTTKGKSAGFARNAAMLEVLGLPDMLVAFPGGKGTNMMVELVEQVNKAAGQELIEILDEREMSF